MGSGYLLGVLAFMTIGGVLVLAVTHFGGMMREKRNRDHATNVFKEDGSSAHTAVRGGRSPQHLQS